MRGRPLKGVDGARARPVAVLVALLVVACPVARPADAIHKCRGADGSLEYRDQPCAPGTAMPTPAIATAPEYVAPPPSPPLAGPGVEPAPAPAPPARAPAPPMQPLFRCERHDGQERYVTSDPEPRRYQVPLWTVDGGYGAAGGALVWVEDRCAPMSAREQCTHLSQRRSEIQTRRRTAFREELERLDAELASVRADLADYCGR